MNFQWLIAKYVKMTLKMSINQLTTKITLRSMTNQNRKTSALNLN